MELLTKKISELTQEDRNALAKPIGTSDLPYPAAHYVDKGTSAALEVGVIADDAHPLAVYSDRSHEYVVGQLFRKMAVPSLLIAQQAAILARTPESRQRVVLFLGKPGAGKSELAKTVADACDPRGAEVVDVGGRYVDEILWEQAIDYGEDFKTALTARLRAGLLSQAAQDTLTENFKDALVLGEDGKITGILWDKTAAPREGEARDAALDRALKTAQTVAQFEGIPAQTTNSMGIKRVPGVIKRAFDEGRTVILDEYTKSVEGSDGALQTLIQFLNGEIDEFTSTNTMKVAGREETYAYTLRRNDMKAGFAVYMTGNDEEDGVSTHALSASANSRLKIFKVGAPLDMDWKHRTSQILTGLPLSTLYALVPEQAQEDADEFAQTLIELRLMGLSDADRARVPVEHLTRLTHWQDTLQAVEKLSSYYEFLSQIVDPNSRLYDDGNGANAAAINNIENIQAEISAAFRDESAMDFRKVIKDAIEAMTEKPQVRRVDRDAGGFRLNLSGVGRETAVPETSPEMLSAEFGSRLSREIFERVCLASEKHPKLREAMLKEGREQGIFGGAAGQDGTVETLLNQDLYAGVGGTESVMALRQAFAQHVRAANPALAGKSDDALMPLDRAIAASETLNRLVESLPAKATGEKGPLIVLGDDAANPFRSVTALNGGLNLRQAPAPQELVSSTDFIESLKIPAVANANLKGVWREMGLGKYDAGTAAIIDIAEGRTQADRVAVTTLMLQAANDNAARSLLHIIADEARGKTLIVTDVKPDAATTAALGDGIAVVSFDDVHAESKVSAFIGETLKHPSREGKLEELELKLTYAFMLRASDEREKVKSLAQMMTRRDLSVESPIYIVNKAPAP